MKLFTPWYFIMHNIFYEFLLNYEHFDGLLMLILREKNLSPQTKVRSSLRKINILEIQFSSKINYNEV